MNLKLLRLQFLPTCTKGALYVQSEFFCFTLEPPLTHVGVQNVPDFTCVPEAIYRLARRQSIRFARIVPLLLDVPNREGIEIHPLNLPSQTEGCIGVGYQWMQDAGIGDSHRAFDALMGKLNPAFDQSAEVTIAIESVYEVPHV